MNRICKTAALLPAACGLLLAVHAASAHEIYAKAGFPGVGAGYAHSLNEHFGVQVDFSTLGTISRNGVAEKLRYNADMKADELDVYGNWFPFGGSFRLSGGLLSRTLEVNVNGRSTPDGNISIGNIEIPYQGDAVQARVEWPKIAPYLGIGWGHHARHEAGFGFIADLGVSFGSPKATLALSDDLRGKLDEAAKLRPGINTDVDAEINRQRRAIAKDVETVKVFPHVFVGVSYQF